MTDTRQIDVQQAGDYLAIAFHQIQDLRRMVMAVAQKEPCFRSDAGAVATQQLAQDLPLRPRQTS